MDVLLWHSCCLFTPPNGETQIAMDQKKNLEILLFYSNHNVESQGTRIALHEFVRNSARTREISVKEVNYDLEKDERRLHGVLGTPTLLIYRDQELCGSYFGGLTYQEIESCIYKCFESQS